MAKLDIQPLDIQPLDIEPLDIQPIKQKTTLGEDIASSFAGVGNTVDTAGTMLYGAIKGAYGADTTDTYDNLKKRRKARDDFAGIDGKEQGLGGKLAGTLATLPMQLLSFPLSPFETGMTMLDQGESLPRAIAGTGIDTLGNMAGVALPGAVGGKTLTKAVSGFGINAAQDAATRAAIAEIAQNQATKDILGPTLENTLVAGLVGAGVGAVSKGKAKAQTRPNMPNVDDIVKANKPIKATDAPITEAPPSTIQVDGNGNAMRPEDAMWRDRAQQMQIDALKPIDDAQVEMLQQGLGEQADAILAKRQMEMEQEVRRQQQLDFNAAERARQEQAPTGYDNWQANKAVGEAQQTFDFLSRAKQDEIDATPYGQRPANYGMTDEFGRVDENGMPVRADLSIEAQNLQDPLQRNLWGDELGGPTWDKGKSLTEALDSLPVGPERDAAIAQLTGQQQPAGMRYTRRGGKQSGAVDFQAIVDLFPSFKGSKIQYPVYHGSTHVFNDIKASKDGGALGNGVYMAVRPEYASMYAEGNGANIHQSYVNIQNPLIIDGPGDPMINALVTLGMTPEKASKLVEKAYDDKGYITNEVRSRAQKLGYDGIEQRRNGKPSEIVAFSPEQVKSAISPGFKDTSKGMGRKQSGQLRIDDIVEGVKSIRKRFGTTPDSIKAPISQENIEAKQKEVQRVKTTANILGTKLPEWADPQTFEETAALSREAKDIASNPYTRGLASGMNFMAAYHNNPLLKYARKLINDARGEQTTFSKQYITSPDGVGTLAAKLSAEDKLIVNQLITSLDKNQVEYTPQIREQLGLSDAADTFMQSMKRATDAEWQWRKKITGEQGVNTAPFRKGYAPGVFSGAYSSIVMDKDGSPLAVLSVDTPGEFMKAKQYYTEKHPGAKFSADTWQQARRGFSGGQNAAFRYRDLGAMIDLLTKADGDFSKVQMAVSADALRASTDLFDFNVHNLRKKGVEGNLGNKPWMNPEKNATQRIDSLVHFLEEAAEHHALQKASEELRLLSADDSTTNLVNTKQYLDDYFNNISGRYMHNGGKIINAAFDGVHLGVESIAAHIPGARNYIGPGNTLKLSNAVKNKMAQMYMGWFNFMFLASQLAQPVQTGAPWMQLVANRLGTDAGSVTAAMSKGLAQYISADLHRYGIVDSIDPRINSIIEWGKNRGILDFTELERAYEGGKTEFGRKFDQLGEWSMQQGEAMTRPPMFLAFVEMLSKVEPDLNKALPMAENLTNQAMADYHKWERPLMYSGFGVLSPHIGGLTTFKHNFAGTQVLLGKEAGKKGLASKAPLALSAMSILAFAGVTGTPFYDEFNSLYEMVREKYSGERRSISQDMLAELPQYMKTGVVSSLLELNMQGKFSSANMVPDTFTQAAFPHLSGAGTIAADAYKAATDPTATNLSNLAVSSTPSGFKQGMNALVNKEDNWLIDRRGERDVQRTPEEWKKSIVTGLVPLKEATDKTRRFQNIENEKARTDKMKATSVKFREAIIANESPDTIANILNDYESCGGSVPTLLKQIPEIQKEAQMSAQERAQGIPKSPASLRKYEAFNN